MTLATVIMNMVYLTSETRSRIGEPGINDPTVKIVVTAATFYVLYALNSSGNLDPSSSALERTARNSTAGLAAATNLHLPLPGVCETRRDGLMGVGVFAAMSVGCLGFVVFGTSAQVQSPHHLHAISAPSACNLRTISRVCRLRHVPHSR